MLHRSVAVLRRRTLAPVPKEHEDLENDGFPR